MNREHVELDRLKAFALNATSMIEYMRIAGQYGHRLESGCTVSNWLPDDPSLSLSVQLWTPVPSIRPGEKTESAAKLVITVAEVPFVISAGCEMYRHEADQDAPLHPFWQDNRWKPEWDGEGHPMQRPYMLGADYVRTAISDYAVWHGKRSNLVHLCAS
jgi:hypothetical protein